MNTKTDIRSQMNSKNLDKEFRVRANHTGEVQRFGAIQRSRGRTSLIIALFLSKNSARLSIFNKAISFLFEIHPDVLEDGRKMLVVFKEEA